MSLTIDVPTSAEGDRLVVNASMGSGMITIAICLADGMGWDARLSLKSPEALKALRAALDHAARYACMEDRD